jgi:hypothetical protein
MYFGKKDKGHYLMYIGGEERISRGREFCNENKTYFFIQIV